MDKMSSLDFVITGTGRSGTGYLSRLLSTLDVPCGHEKIFHPFLRDDVLGCSNNNLIGDSSWLAAPLLEQLSERTWVFHQVRHPIEVARSFLGIGFFDKNPSASHSPYLEFVRRHQSFDRIMNEFERFMFHWVCWNQMVETKTKTIGLNYHRIKLEDMDAESINTQLLSKIGRSSTIQKIHKAQAVLGSITNSRIRRGDISYNNLPKGEIFDRFWALAIEYGYDVEAT
jgi:hypothetical protein